MNMCVRGYSAGSRTRPSASTAPRLPPGMNGNDASGVHGAMDGTATAIPVTAEASFEEFFDAERVALLRGLYLLCGNAEEAEEIVQDSFLSLWERWARMAATADPTGYLYRTALNRYRSRARRAMRAARRSVGLAHGADLFA